MNSSKWAENFLKPTKMKIFMPAAFFLLLVAVNAIAEPFVIGCTYDDIPGYKGDACIFAHAIIFINFLVSWPSLITFSFLYPILPDSFWKGFWLNFPLYFLLVFIQDVSAFIKSFAEFFIDLTFKVKLGISLLALFLWLYLLSCLITWFIKKRWK